MRIVARIMAGALVSATVARGAERADFERDVRPVLAEQCVSCHGPEKHKGGLRLDRKEWALQGGDSGKVIEAGHGEQSLLLKVLRGPSGDVDQMPYKKEPLSAGQVQLIARWIEEGANWPAGVMITPPKHWAFVPPVTPPVPHVSGGWARNPIDCFVQERLEREGIQASAEAPRETLIRRVYLDLTGLPPSIKEIDEFLADRSPDAYEKIVDRLLASPHYGERWARHWLDGARYADSNGYSIDAPRTIWPYRDWVIKALNADMPFDRFTIEQLAGDLLPGATAEQKIATGFHRNTQINEEGGIDPEQFRVEAVVDRVGTTGTVFLGLTVACAQCHDHKFDPITQREYYRLFAFFNNCDEPKMPVSNARDEAQAAFVAERIAKYEEEFAQSRAAVEPRIPAWEAALDAAAKAKLDVAAQRAIKVPPEKRNARQKAAVAEAFLASDAEYMRKKKDYESLKGETAAVTTLVLQEHKGEPRKSWIFIKGDFTRHGNEVTAGVPAVLPELKADKPSRLDLARWIVDPANPLTARVQVNRMWMQFFGRGIVETDNDFGTQGTRPSNQPLLDWLATEFIRQKWSMKAMHRLLVTSTAYRQASNVQPELMEKDPYNRLIARQSRVRLDAEVVRDVELAASGLLSDKIGGPSVFPPQPEGVTSVGQIKRAWKVSEGPDRYRRGLYTWVWRMTPHPLLTSFDVPDATLACTRRNRSNTPLQALTLLNDAAFVEFAQVLAGRVVKEASGDEKRLRLAFRLATGRNPSADEMALLMRLLTKQRQAYAADAVGAKQVCGGKAPAGLEEREFAAWVMVGRVVLNVDEAITRE
jgi:mono/diheme cytochrome c family protein